jgi:hypothetical protein
VYYSYIYIYIIVLYRGIHIYIYIYICIGVPLCNPREGGCVGADGQIARGGGARKTLKL